MYRQKYKVLMLGLFVIKICITLLISITRELILIHNIASYIIINCLQELKIGEDLMLYKDILKLHNNIDINLSNNIMEQLLTTISIFCSQLYLLANPAAVWDKVIEYGNNQYYRLPHLLESMGYTFPPIYRPFYCLKYILNINLEHLLFCDFILNIIIICYTASILLQIFKDKKPILKNDQNNNK